MLIQRKDNTFDAGPLDVLCILHNLSTNTYHAAFFEEYSFPGKILPVDKIENVRLKSKMHHTEGAATLEGALKQLEDLSNKVHVPESNIWRDPKPWDGVIPIVWVYSNWLKK